MNQLITALLFFVLSISCAQGASIPEEQDDWDESWPVYRNDCFIAFLNDTLNDGQQELYRHVDEEAKRGLNVTRMFEFENAEPGFVFMGDKESAKKVAKMRGVKRVIPDYVVVGQQANKIQWHLDRVDQHCLPLNNSYYPFTNGSGVDIYILDSGANFNHSDIKDKLVYPGRDMIDEVTGSNKQGSDCQGHGTHVAALAAGDKYGNAPGAKIIVIRVLDCYNYGPYSAVMKGIDYAVELIKQRKRKAVVSMSLLGIADDSFDNSVRKLVRQGIPVVVAAGNYKSSSCDYSPSRLTEVITVAATQEENDLLYWFTSHVNSPGTNYGSCVDIFAPGQWVRSAGHDCTDCRSSRSGTSMSTPLVSGAVALLLQKYPHYQAPQIKELLISMSTKNVLNFSSLPDNAESRSTPNRLLFVPRGDQILSEVSASASCSISTPLPQPTATSRPSSSTTTRSELPIQRNSTYNPPSQTTKPTNPPSQTTGPTNPPSQTTGPTHSPSQTTGPTHSPSQTSTRPTPSSSVTVSPRTSPPVPSTAPTTPPTTPPTEAHLLGTLFEKTSQTRCYGKLLDSSSPVIYEDIPKDSLQKYADDLKRLGFRLADLSVMSYGWEVESRFIMIFSIKKKVETISFFRYDYRSFRIALLRYGGSGYFPYSVTPSFEIDEQGKSSFVYSAVLYKDISLQGSQISYYSSLPSVLNTLRKQNSSSSSFQTRVIGSIANGNSEVGYLTVRQRSRRYHYVYFAEETMEAVRRIIKQMHQRNYYLHRFDSHWVSSMSMSYNMIFTPEPRENCDYKLIMDMDRQALQHNAAILKKQGWVPTVVGTHLSPRGFSLNFISVWWK